MMWVKGFAEGQAALGEPAHGRDHDRPQGRRHAVGHQPRLLPSPSASPSPSSRTSATTCAPSSRPTAPTAGRCLMASKFDADHGAPRRDHAPRPGHGLQRVRAEPDRLRLRAHDGRPRLQPRRHRRHPDQGRRGQHAAARAAQPHRPGAQRQRAGQGRAHLRQRRGRQPGGRLQGPARLRRASTWPRRRATRASSRRPRATTAPPWPARRRATACKCIIVQETYDSRKVGQPEIVEKARICEAYGAEVVQLTVGPELFFHMVELLDKTGYFAASLYSSFGVIGHRDPGPRGRRARCARSPAPTRRPCVVTHAGGGNTTGTARGLRRAGATGTQIVSASVDLCGPAHGLRRRLQPQELHHRPHRLRRALRHLARPRRRAAQRGPSAALHRPLPHGHAGRGLLHDRGPGQARGPRARPGRQHRHDRRRLASPASCPREATVVVQETEYTGAGKHHWAQLNFAKADGRRGARRRPARQQAGHGHRHPRAPRPDPGQRLRRRAHARKLRAQRAQGAPEGYVPTADDIAFLAADTNSERGRRARRCSPSCVRRPERHARQTPT